MQAPAYQEHPAASMPVETRDGGVEVKVIAGATSRGTKGPVTVEPTDARYFDLTLPDGATFEEPLGSELAGFVVVHAGTIAFPDGSDVGALGLAELGSGDAVRFTAKGGSARVLVIAGKPIREPVAWHGPFVMNTRDELVAAFEDYQAGRF
jgi:redox-sensitive bicupin YhaK (pirin superfamily)